MAPKTVQPIDIKLGIKGGEQLGKLSGAFRDLAKTVGQTDAGLEEARKSIIEYGKTANQSEALIRGQIKAFEGLQKQAELGGKVFTQLENDIKALGGVLYGASAAVEAKRKSLVDLGSSANATTAQIQGAIKALTVLRGETRLDSEAFNVFGQSIDRLAEKFEKAKQEAQDFASAQARSGRFISASSGAAKQQIKDLDLVTQALREQREELGRLEGEARIRRGVADLAGRGAASSSRRSYQEALAESVLSGTAEEVAGTEASLKKLLSAKDIRAALAEVELQIAEFQKQVESKLSRGLQISFQETSRAARESARAMAAAFADPELLGILDRLDQRIGELPNTTAGFNQRLRELQQQLANTARDFDAYVSVSLEIARVQREAAAATQGLGAALVRDLNTGIAARNAKNLREAIGQLQSEMNELDVQTAEGSRRYAENANQVRNLETQLRQLGDSYRHVSDMAQQAASAQGVYANTATARNYLNRAMVRAQEAAGAQLAEAVRAGIAATPLMLPAAGGTTAPGTGALRSGMAEEYIPTDSRIGGRLGETPDQPSRGRIGDVQAISARRSIGPQATEEQIDRARRAHISRSDAIRAETEAKEAAARAEQSLRKEIDLARKAYNGSINSTNNLRGAIDRYRSTLPLAREEFEQLTREIIDLDRKSEAVSRRMSRRRMSPMQMTQAAGAAISGGIFGGPEGFLGGAIGAIGGVGSAFAGAAIGAQVGGLRRQLGEFADYAAGIQKLQIALEGVAGSQNEFNRAMAAASSVTKELNVPQDIAIRGMTRLTAAVKGAGGGVADAELAFKSINSAIIATGGGAEQVEGAVTALVQIFSKGKVSAEEINQIAERLPGTFNKIAEASGRTGPELTKALQDGSVGLNDLMKFLVQLGDDYGTLAEKIAKSSESAGARLQVAYDKMRQEVGKALQPIGAEFQAAFAEFVEDVTPALVAILPNIGQAVLALAKNIDTLVVAVASFGSAFAAIKFAAIISSLGGVASTAALAGKSLAAMNLAAMVNPAYLLAAGVAAIGVSLYDTWRQQEEFNRVLREAPLDEVNKKIDELRQSINDLDAKSRSAASGMSMFGGSVGFASAQAAQLKQDLQDLIARQQELALYEEAGVRVRPGFYGPGFAAPPEQKPLTDFKPPALEDAGKGAAKTARDADRRAEEIASLKRALDLGEAKGRIFEIEERIKATGVAIVDAQNQNNFAALRQLQGLERSLEHEKRRAEIITEYNAKMREIKETSEGEIRDLKEKLASQERSLALQRAEVELNAQNITAQQQLTQLKKEQSKSFEQQFTDRQRELGLISEPQYNKILMARERERLAGIEGLTPEQRQRGLDLYRQEIDPTPFESMQQNITQLKRELKELVDPINQITGAANAIGTSFADSFKSVVSGSATAQEALAGFFRNIANYFLDMAAQIIQKWITMVILNTALKLFPSGSGGSGGDIFADIASRGGLRFAKGGIMTEDGPMPLRTYARGGIARSPQLAVFGEGSMPEAYVPLPDGRSIPVTMEGGKASTNVVVNVDASGTSVQGDDRMGKELGNAISVAVQAELIKQQRPGGLLNR